MVSNEMIIEKRKNLAKTLYDLSKLIYAGLVIGYFINPKTGLKKLILGIMSTVIFFYYSIFC